VDLHAVPRDVVKMRIGELETERTALTDYITGTR
jgi:hypothetical protein